MDTQALFVNSILKDARGKAQQRIADAVRLAMTDYHNQTGGHIVSIDLRMVSHQRAGSSLVDTVMLMGVSLTCTVGE